MGASIQGWVSLREGSWVVPNVNPNMFISPTFGIDIGAAFKVTSNGRRRGAPERRERPISSVTFSMTTHQPRMLTAQE